MTELASKERLQPALLDRLTDEERNLIVVSVSTTRSALDAIRLPLRTFIEILVGQGLKLTQDESLEGAIRLRFAAAPGATPQGRLRELVIRPPGAPDGVTLQAFATVESEVVRNVGVEPVERRAVSMRRLRESVCRDLSWLLNCMSLDATEDLSAYPEVQRSVLNYGMPSFAGRAAVSVDLTECARRIERTIEIFEPRLSAVRVTPQTGQGAEGVDDRGADGSSALTFFIEAQLWGQPVAQQLHLRTSIDVGTGDVSVADAVSG